MDKVNIDLIQSVVAQVLAENQPSAASVPNATPCLMTETGFFPLTLAKQMAQAAEEKATQMGVAISIAVVDVSGNLVLFHRMPDSVQASVPYAHHKAYTAATYQWPSGNMDELISPPSAMTALLNIDPKVTSLGGGLPIRVKGRCIGGLGISGGAIVQDIEIGSFVLSRFFEQ